MDNNILAALNEIAEFRAPEWRAADDSDVDFLQDIARAALARAGIAAPAAPTFWKSQAKMIERAIIGLRDGWATRKDADDALAILAAPAAAQDEPSKLQKDLDSIADELEQEAANYEGGFADTVNGCAEALRKIANRTAVQEGAGEVDAKDAALWRFLVRDGKSLNGRFTLVRCDGDKLTELHGGEYESAVKAAIAAQPKDTTDTRREA